jgi:2-desacetyl-2-hydroxyethyl bacteriochlorophyllide A dehydrogenase
MKKTMRAGQLMGPLNYQIVEVPIPKPGPNEVLMKMEATAICGSEYGLYYGISSSKPLWERKQDWPMPPGREGHEGAGIIVEVGSDVKDFHVGDRVQGGDAAYAEYALAPVAAGSRRHLPWYATHLPDNISFEDGVWLVTAAETMRILYKGKIQEGDSVALVGSGAVGLMVLQHLKAANVKDVICSDVVDWRLEIAKKLGAKVVINAVKENIIKRILDETDGKGVDIVVDSSGQTKTLNQEVEYIKRGGFIIVYGRPQSPLNDFTLEKAWGKSIEIICNVENSIRGDYDKDQIQQETINLIANSKYDLKSMSTIYPLDDIDRGFKEAAVNRKEGIIKIILKP